MQQYMERLRDNIDNYYSSNVGPLISYSIYQIVAAIEWYIDRGTDDNGFLNENNINLTFVFCILDDGLDNWMYPRHGPAADAKWKLFFELARKYLSDKEYYAFINYHYSRYN